MVALYGATIFLLHSMDQARNEKRSILAPPPPGLKYFHFGFSEALADSLWLSYIQNIEACSVLLNDESAEKLPECRKGWAFQMLDQITDLAPRFRMPYAVGPL